ncbi:hypothetical protein D3C73_814910 [compost metagenome]
MGGSGINISALVSNGADIFLIKRADDAAVILHLPGGRVILPYFPSRIRSDIDSSLFIRRNAVGDRLSRKFSHLNGLMRDWRVLP